MGQQNLDIQTSIFQNEEVMKARINKSSVAN